MRRRRPAHNTTAQHEIVWRPTLAAGAGPEQWGITIGATSAERYSAVSEAVRPELLSLDALDQEFDAFAGL